MFISYSKVLTGVQPTRRGHRTCIVDNKVTKQYDEGSESGAFTHFYMTPTLLRPAHESSAL